MTRPDVFGIRDPAVSDDGQFLSTSQMPTHGKTAAPAPIVPTTKRHAYTLTGDGPGRFRYRQQGSSAPFPRVGESNRAIVKVSGGVMLVASHLGAFMALCAAVQCVSRELLLFLD